MMSELEFKEKLEEIKKLKGKGTELVSLYIPTAYPIHTIRDKISQEISEASNIKSKTTRKNVINALEKILYILKGINKTPENGLILFVGTIDDKMVSYILEPPFPLNIQIYRCDSSFYTEPLEEILEDKDVYGLVVLDNRAAVIGMIKHKQIIQLRTIKSFVHPKHRAGGQSAQRFARIIEHETREYYKKVGEEIDKIFLGMKNFRGLIIGGPGHIKEDFYKLRPFNYSIKVLGLVDTAYVEDYGLQELLERGKELLKEQELIKERELIKEFFKAVFRDNKGVYGIKDVITALKDGRIDKLLMHKDFNLYYLKLKDENGHEKEIIGEKKEYICDICGKKMQIIEEKDLKKEILRIAKEMGVEVIFIESNISEAEQFKLSFKGIGGILRY